MFHFAKLNLRNHGSFPEQSNVLKFYAFAFMFSLHIRTEIYNFATFHGSQEKESKKEMGTKVYFLQINNTILA